MSDGVEVHHGLEGVVAFESEIAEPDKEGSALRYRGVDIDDLVGRVPFEKIWGLLVDGTYEPGLGQPSRSPSRSTPATSAPTCRAPSPSPLPPGASSSSTTSTTRQVREDLARTAVMVLSYVAQAARGVDKPMVPQAEIDKCDTIIERMLTRWRGEVNPDHAKAIDAYLVSAAEHGMNASTFTARVIASTGADVAAALSGAVGAMSGPLHGGAPARVLTMIEDVEKSGDATALRQAACSTPANA